MTTRPEWMLPGPEKFSRNRLAIDTVPRITAVTPNSGRTAGGAAVTLSGFNFRKENDGSSPIVLFGGVAATSVVVVDGNTITCVTPAVAAAGLIDIGVFCGTQSGTLYGAFTYYTSTILSVSPNHGTFNGGTEVFIKGFNFVAGSSVTIGGTALTGLTIVDEENIVGTTANHVTGYADIVVTEPGGAAATLRNGFKFTLLTRGEDIRRTPGITIRDVLNNQPNNCTFTVDGESSPPEVGEQIEITDSQDGDRLLFRGQVQSVTQIYEDDPDNLAWQVSAIDFTFQLNKYRPFGSYKNVSASYVVIDLLNKFAPSFDASFVQTNLAKVTANFDGSQDLSTCLNAIATAIGGGHWYVDYEQRVHFFHTIPQGIILPDAPQSIIHMGPGTAMTVSEGAAIPTTDTFPIGFYLFRSTFVYDNGLESALSPFSNCVALQGTKIISFTGVPIGANVGTHIVLKRRIYYQYIGPLGITKLAKMCEVNDNITTAFTTYGLSAVGASVAAVVNMAATVTVPRTSYVAPPAGAAAGPSAAQGVASIYTPQYPPLFGAHAAMTYTPGPWQFKVTNVYRDGTESLPSLATNTIILDGIHSADLGSIPVGAPINGVDVVARKIYGCQGSGTTKTLAQVVAELTISYKAGTLHKDYGQIIGYGDADALQNQQSIPTSYSGLANVIGFSDLEVLMHPVGDPDWSPEHTKMWYLLNDNTTTTAQIGPGTGEGVPPVNSANSADIPVWPNPDGPSLENADPPDAITDGNDDLLRDPPFTRSIDMSQLRNRVFVRGAGTFLVEAAVVGATQLKIADTTLFAVNGGLVKAGYNVFDYASVSVSSGQGFINLRDPLAAAIDVGTAVNLFFQADDLESQKELAKVELTNDGLPTDGVHEYTITDTSLTTPLQLYMRAYAELEQFGRPIVTIRYATRDPKTKSGSMVTVDMTSPPCVGEFLIQDVTIDQIHDESDQLLPRYVVTASSVKFELSDLLLLIAGQQSGDGVQFAGVTATIDAAPVTVTSVATYVATVDITALQVTTMATVPIEVIAGIPGSIIVPTAWVVEGKTTTAFSGLNAWNLVYAGGTIGTVGPVTLGNRIGSTYQYVKAGVITNGSFGFDVHVTGLGIQIKATSNVTGGAGSFRIAIMYYVFSALG